jgi:hypothetical protein
LGYWHAYGYIKNTKIYVENGPKALFPNLYFIYVNYRRRPLGRPRSRWEDNIMVDLQEVVGSCGDWMELAQYRDRWRALVGTVRNLRVPKMRGIS